MDLDDLGAVAADDAVESLASSLPLPPQDPRLPPPPATGGHDDGSASLTPDEQSQPRATVPVVLALVLTVLVAAGGFALVSWATGGAVCGEADFESVRFGYCASTPAGWTAAAAQGKDTPLDRFLLRSGPAVITVTAVPLTRGQDLARFEQFVRGFDETVGASAGRSMPLEVDGVDAVAFDAALEGPDGVVRSREVLFVRAGIAWRVTLADEQVGFEASLERLGSLLDSWRFI